MANYQTLKNTLKKLESHQKEKDHTQQCGVIYADEYEKMVLTGEGFKTSKSKVGYLVVPRQLTLAEWQLEYAQ